MGTGNHGATLGIMTENINSLLFVLRSAGFGLTVLMLDTLSNSALPATILIDDFPGTGGVPSGWTLNVGTGTVSHANSIVTINNDGGFTPTVIGQESALFNPQGTTTVLLTEIAGINGEGGGPSVGSGGNRFSWRLEEDGALDAIMGLSSAPGTSTFFSLPAILGYAGGDLDVTLSMDAAGFRVTTATGYDSGAVTWVTAFGGAFDLSTLGTSVRPGLGAVAPTLTAEIRVDRVVLSTVPIPATVWMFGSALGILGWLRRIAE